MKTHHQVELLHILWELLPEKEYVTSDGQKITVLQRGEYDQKKEKFCGAKIRCGDNIYHGEIVIWAGEQLPEGDFESTILHVAPFPSASILKNDGQLIPQVTDNPDPIYTAAYLELKKNRSAAGCSQYISAYDPHERVGLYTRLMVDRLYDRYTEIMEVLGECEQNWNETLYAMLLRAMGRLYNKEAFGNLARTVGYKYICKEKSSIYNIEALLLGGSGLLELYEDDQYIRHLKETFTHFCRKYGIVPMRAGQWELGRNRAEGQPVIRLAQLAGFFMKQDFLFDQVMKCRTVENVQDLFRVEASVYWSTHLKPVPDSPHKLKKLGHDRANMLGINFIVPVQFAYGIHTADEGIKEAALDLLEKINRESIRLLDMWQNKGAIMENAFDSQAILQLDKEFCKKGLCWKCPVGRRVVKELYKSRSAQKV